MYSLLLLASSLLLATLPLTEAQAQAADPASAAAPAASEHERLLAAYLQGFNAKGTAALVRFAKDHLSESILQGLSPEQISEKIRDARRMAEGGFDLCRMETNTASELAAILKSHGEFPLYVRLNWTFAAGRPDQITDIKMQPANPPAEEIIRLDPERLVQELEARLTRLAAHDQFSGAVLIARNGQPLWQKAYGYADREAKIPNTLQTRFRLGSMNKMITSVAIAQLVQAGKLRYTDTIAQVLPDYPNPEVARKVTIHHLLTHTSGLGDIFGPEFDRRKETLREIKDYLSLFAAQPLQFEPGSRWAYSNAGFIVLGLILEKISGQSYYDYVQQHIYDVAGMKASGSFPKTDKVPHLAVGYMREQPNSPLTPNWDTLPWRGMSAGGGDSTLGDLLRFDQALRQHKLLAAEWTETILSGKVQPGQDKAQQYAYGFEDLRMAGHRIVGHSGGAPGMNAQLDMYLDNGYTVVVLSNLDPPIAQRVAGYIRQSLP